MIDVVHPSLFPLIYGRSRILPPGQIINLADCIDYIGKGETASVSSDSDIEVDKSYRMTYRGRPTPKFWSKNFQWLPCNVLEHADGVKIVSYINNLHPIEHAELYSVIEQFIAKSIPLWDQILFSLDAQRHPRIDFQCTEYDFPQEMPEDWRAETGASENEPRELWKKSNRVLIRPEPENHGFLNQNKDQGRNLRSLFGNQGLQVIVKLANIELTPDKPDYEGGSWHIEGLMNEHICASSLYYYDSHNITESFLGFRHRADDDDQLEFTKAYDQVWQPLHMAGDLQLYTSFQIYKMTNDQSIQDDYSGVEELYDIHEDDDKVQGLGRVSTPQGRLLAFPNVLQHRVSPFTLQDRTRPGHRKILALFLVDPHIPILSTANVPPQQREWWRKGLQEEKALGKLPNELADRVVDEVSDFPISLQEAKELRLDVLEERKAYANDVDADLKTLTFSFCEH